MQIKSYSNNIWNHEYERNEQGYGAKSYFELMLNRLKIMGLTFILKI
jgi:hypothetical protein